MGKRKRHVRMGRRINIMCPLGNVLLCLTLLVFSFHIRSLDVLNSVPPPRVLNTHVYASCLPSDVINKRIKIIHVMRHPKDIAVSFYYHFRFLNFAFEEPPYESFSDFLPYITGEYGVCKLMLSTLGKTISADDILKYFSYFPLKTGFDILCKLSPIETICMKCQILFYEKKKKKKKKKRKEKCHQFDI